MKSPQHSSTQVNPSTALLQLSCLGHATLCGGSQECVLGATKVAIANSGCHAMAAKWKWTSSIADFMENHMLVAEINAWSLVMDSLLGVSTTPMSLVCSQTFELSINSSSHPKKKETRTRTESRKLWPPIFVFS